MKSIRMIIYLAIPSLLFVGCSTGNIKISEEKDSAPLHDTPDYIVTEYEVAKRDEASIEIVSDAVFGGGSDTIANTPAPIEAEADVVKYYKVLQEDKYFKVLGNDDDYRFPYFIYNAEGFVVDSGEVYHPPVIMYISSDIIEIRFIGGGTNVNIRKYYHTSLEKVSEYFESPFLVEDERIVYYDGKNLIVQNIFDPNIFFWEHPMEMYLTTGGDIPAEFLDKGKKIKITHSRPSDDVEETIVFNLE